MDINGELRIRNAPDGNKLTNVLLSTDGVGNVEDSGTFRELLNAHMEQPKASNLVLNAAGGSDLVYGNGDWANNSAETLLLNEGTDTDNQYNPATGLFTVGSGNEGFYYIKSRIVLYNDLGIPVSVFDGESGVILTGVFLNGAAIAEDFSPVLSGVKTSGGNVLYALYANSFVYLEAGDVINLGFKTYGTDNMNLDKSKIFISKNATVLSIYRLY